MVRLLVVGDGSGTVVVGSVCPPVNALGEVCLYVVVNTGIETYVNLVTVVVREDAVSVVRVLCPPW